MIPDSFYKIDSMSGKYSITPDSDVQAVHHGRYRVSIVAKEEIGDQLKEMTIQGNNPVQLESTC